MAEILHDAAKQQSARSLIPPLSKGELKATPMIKQYIEIKAAHQDFLLLYRMGDFYELFFHDAVEAAEILKITLTHRGKHLGEDIPMCGIPVHSYEDYLQKLISLGYRVAICEQIEDSNEAKKRSGKTLLERRVVRIVTPATLTEAKLLDPQQANYLMSIGIDRERQEYALSWIDISTGVFRVAPSQFDNLLADIMRFEPKEILISEDFFEQRCYQTLLKALGPLAVPMSAIYFSHLAGEKRIKDFYNLQQLSAIEDFSRAEISAIASAIAYIEKTQIDKSPLLMRPKRLCHDSTIFIDNATRNNLELLRSLSGNKEGSLIRAINRTITAAGARLLAERVIAPLVTPHKINQRLDSVSYFYREKDICRHLRELLRSSPDMPRSLSRIAIGRAVPQDLQDIYQGLKLLLQIKEFFKDQLLPQELSEAYQLLDNSPLALFQHLGQSLEETLPPNKRQGGFIKKGYNGELDNLRKLRDESKEVILELQQKYIAQTGLKSLKIKYNNLLGYFIEVTNLQASALTQNPDFKNELIHRQTLVNSTRFSTRELTDLEINITQAAEKALDIELSLFDKLSQQIIDNADFIRQAAALLARFDVSASLAILAQEQGYCRPIIDHSLNFIIEEGRHPVVEQALRRKGEKPFIANNCDLSPKERLPIPHKREASGALWLLTGPNMGGKSTFLRQNALITLMAQMGSYVPAKKAHIGVIDRLFSRVGAADNLAQGHSTFMVEMIETATILNQASSRALVILDEIGRGTATLDGLAIACACVEYLHEHNRCRTLFATHFHELTKLENKLPNLTNITLQVKEWQGEIVFLHKIIKGTASHSYGIYVARLAGLPQEVIERAKRLLSKLEQDPRYSKNRIIDRPNNAPPAPDGEGRHNSYDSKEINNQKGPPAIPANGGAEANSLKLKEAQNGAKLYHIIKALNPDNMSPRQALEQIYQLKAQIAKSE